MFAKEYYPGQPKFTFNKITNQPFYISDLKIVPIRVMHHKLPILGYRMADISYITEASYISDEEKSKLIGSEILIINALQKEKHVSHYNLEQSLELIHELQPEKAYLTHLTALMDYQELIRICPKNVEPAFDNLEIII